MELRTGQKMTQSQAGLTLSNYSGEAFLSASLGPTPRVGDEALFCYLLRLPWAGLVCTASMGVMEPFPPYPSFLSFYLI